MVALRMAGLARFAQHGDFCWCCCHSPRGVCGWVRIAKRIQARLFYRLVYAGMQLGPQIGLGWFLARVDGVCRQADTPRWLQCAAAAARPPARWVTVKGNRCQGMGLTFAHEQLPLPRTHQTPM